MSTGVTLSSKGDYSKITKYLHEANRLKKITAVLEKYGEEGVKALQDATPKRTGKTASSWEYKVSINDGNRTASISFWNTNENQGVPIALLIQYGHGLKGGGFVEGIDYINPVIQPLFEQMAEEGWKEVTKI